MPLIRPMVPMEIRSSLVPGLGKIFLRNMRHQPQVPLDEHIPGFQVSLTGQSQIMGLLLGRQGLGEASRASCKE